MNIQVLIEQYVSLITFEPCNYYHGETGWQNLFADEDNFQGDARQSVYLDEPIINDYILHKSGLVQEKYNLNALFMKKSHMELTPQQHNLIIQNCRGAARNFINIIRADKNIFELSNVKGLEFKNKFDANCSGISLSFDIIPYSFDSACV